MGHVMRFALRKMPQQRAQCHGRTTVATHSMDIFTCFEESDPASKRIRTLVFTMWSGQDRYQACHIDVQFRNSIVLLILWRGQGWAGHLAIRYKIPMFPIIFGLRSWCETKNKNESNSVPIWYKFSMWILNLNFWIINCWIRIPSAKAYRVASIFAWLVGTWLVGGMSTNDWLGTGLLMNQMASWCTTRLTRTEDFPVYTIMQMAQSGPNPCWTRAGLGQRLRPQLEIGSSLTLAVP